MFKEREESENTNILDILPQRDIVIDDTVYTVYLEQKANYTDRCFAYTVTDTPEEINLFMIVDKPEAENWARDNVSRINIYDDEHMQRLVRGASSLVTPLVEQQKRGCLLRVNIELPVSSDGEESKILSFTLCHLSTNMDVLEKSYFDWYSKIVTERHTNGKDFRHAPYLDEYNQIRVGTE